MVKLPELTFLILTLFKSKKSCPDWVGRGNLGNAQKKGCFFLVKLPLVNFIPKLSEKEQKIFFLVRGPVLCCSFKTMNNFRKHFYDI